MEKLNIETYPLNFINRVGGERFNDSNLPSDYREGFEHALLLCGERESEIVHLRYRDGLAHREIGERFGLKPYRIGQIIDRTTRRIHHPSRFCFIYLGYSEGKKKVEEWKTNRGQMTPAAPKRTYKHGTLVYDPQNQRMDIRFDLNHYCGGLHCGQCFEVFANGHWTPTRIEMAEDWYLVDVPVKDLNGLRVRIPA